VANLRPAAAQPALAGRPSPLAGEGQGAGPTTISPDQSRWLAALYESNFAAVLKRCRAILRSGDDAADAAHEVFLIALSALAPDTEAKRAHAWLLTVAQNHCLDLLRRRRRFGKALLTLGADHDARGDLEAGVVDRDFVDRLLRQLSLRERLVLWQSAVEHRPLADIASGLQLSYAAAAQVVHRARQHAGRLAAGVAAILTLLRFPRALRRVLDRMAPFRTQAESLLVARRAMALAVVSIVAAVSLQSSQSSTAASAMKPPLAMPAPASIAHGVTPPGGLGSLLTPLNGAAAHPGATGATGPVTGVPSLAPPTLESLAHQLAGTLPSTSLPVPVAPGLLPAPTVPPVPSLPPVVP
jgi:RNA polymerase sigma-70 factor, ECF subfamily